MSEPSSDVAFSAAVKQVQSERGSRGTYARIERNGGFRTDVDLSGVAKGNYTLVFTSDDRRDDVDGQAAATTQVVSVK